MLTRVGVSPVTDGALYAIAAALCLIAPFIVFLSANNYSILAIEILPLYIIWTILGMIVGSMFVIRLATVAKFGLWACAFLAVTFLYEIDTVASIAIVLAISGLAAWLLRDNLATIIILAASVHIISTLSLTYFVRSTSLPENQPVPQTTENTDVNLPPVLHLVLDEFSGLRGLPQDIRESRNLAESLATAYTATGFDIFSHAYSQYFQTTGSLPNLLNFTSSDNNRAYFSGSGGRL